METSKQSVVRLIRGPLMLIALGMLFEVQQFTSYSFRRTWPVLLILFGLLKLLEHLAEGFIVTRAQ